MRNHTQDEIQDALLRYHANNDGSTMHPRTSSVEMQYLTILRQLVDGDHLKSTSRTGIKTRRLLQPQAINFCLNGPRSSENPCLLPVITGRQIWWRGALAESLWMWRGDTSLARLDSTLPGASALWENWAIADDQYANRVGPHIGRAYGWQFSSKLAPALESLKTSPDTRRACFSLWEQQDLPLMALPPCHGCFVQFRAIPWLDTHLLCLEMTQRSQNERLN